MSRQHGFFLFDPSPLLQSERLRDDQAAALEIEHIELSGTPDGDMVDRVERILPDMEAVRLKRLVHAARGIAAWHETRLARPWLVLRWSALARAASWRLSQLMAGTENLAGPSWP